MNAKIVCALFLSSALCVVSGCSTAQHEIETLQTTVNVKNRPDFVSNDEHSRQLWDLTTQLYAARGYQPAWAGGGVVNANGEAALRVLEDAPLDGLNPEDFGLPKLQAMRSGMNTTADLNARSQFDLHLTYSLAGYVSRMCLSPVDPRELDASWPAQKSKCDVLQIVSDAITQNKAGKLPEQLAPKIQEYAGLRIALKRYRAAAAQRGWQPLPVQPAKGSRKESVSVDPTMLANALVRTGDLDGDLDGALDGANDQEPFSDEALQAALSQFQARHGLEADGVLTEKTIRALNVPIEQRIEQIATNMDRMRWAAGFEEKHLRVNIPAFQLAIHEGPNVTLQMRVIVGADDNRTPLLDSQIEHLVFSPYWNIPLSIASKEMLPKVQKDPRYFEKEEIEVVRVKDGKVQVIDSEKIDWDEISEDNLKLQLRQKPGAANALGLVKFIFPNPYDVYLHDTPADNLFNRLTRTLSHGCVRVERPTELAAFLLQDQPEWTAERIEEAMNAGKEKRADLKTPLPIHILYWTAWADANGLAQFRDDVYGYDAKQRAALSAQRSALSDKRSALRR